jgi:hypothetical protein
MDSRHALLFALVGLTSAWPLQTIGAQEKPVVQLPQAGVPQIITLEGKFVRVAYNNEGYVILGYQASNRSVGEEWMLLEVGMTVLDNVPDYRLTREALSLETPDGKTIPLATVEEQREGNPQAIQQRAKVQRDSINYFPVRASRGCAILFFPELGSRALPYDVVDLSNDRACVGRLYFKIPGGIAYGQQRASSVGSRSSAARRKCVAATAGSFSFSDNSATRTACAMRRRSSASPRNTS